MVQYQVKNLLLNIRLVVQGTLENKVLCDVNAQIGPALMGRKYRLGLERVVQPDQSLILKFQKNDQSETWTISADRKMAFFEGKEISRADVLNAGEGVPEDYVWGDPSELFLSAQSFAEKDQGKNVLRRFLIPSFGSTMAGTFIFHLEGPRTCRVESVDLSFRKKKLGFQTKTLVLKDQIDGVYPAEVKLAGFDPFNFVLKATQTS